MPRSVLKPNSYFNVNKGLFLIRWTILCKVTEALFKEIWESLAHIADINNDGRITQAEWVRLRVQWSD